jgi:hypothetical protein
MNAKDETENLLSQSTLVHLGGNRPAWKRLLTRAAFMGVWFAVGMGIYQTGRVLIDSFSPPESVETISEWSPPPPPPLPAKWFSSGRFTWHNFSSDRHQHGLNSATTLLQFKLLNHLASPMVFNSGFRPTASFAAGFELRRALAENIINGDSRQFWQWWPAAVASLQAQADQCGDQLSDFWQGVGLPSFAFPEDIKDKDAWYHWAENNNDELLAPIEVLAGQPADAAADGDVQSAAARAGLAAFSYPFILDTPTGHAYLVKTIDDNSKGLSSITGWGPKTLGLDRRIIWNFRQSSREGAQASSAPGEGVIEISALPKNLFHEWFHALSATTAKSIVGHPTRLLVSDVWNSWSLRSSVQRDTWRELNSVIAQQKSSIIIMDDTARSYVAAAKLRAPRTSLWLQRQPNDFRARFLNGGAAAMQQTFKRLRSEMAASDAVDQASIMVWLWTASTIRAGLPTAGFAARRAMIDEYAEMARQQGSPEHLDDHYYTDSDELWAATFAAQEQDTVSVAAPLPQERSGYAKEWRHFFSAQASWWHDLSSHPLRELISAKDAELPPSLRRRLLASHAVQLPPPMPELPTKNSLRP